MELKNENSWATCPDGYFLQGLYRSDKYEELFMTCWYWCGNTLRTYYSKSGLLRNIEDGRCSKPVGHPDNYGHCTNEDISECLDNEATCSCKKDGYYITGIYKGNCDGLSCIERIRCCRLADQPEKLDSHDKVITHIMEKTLRPMAYLANILGYGWCAGCRAPYVGEDFRRHGDTWVADKTDRCEGFKSDHRLDIKFDNWRFEAKETIYGKEIVEAMDPQYEDGGTVLNWGSTEANQKFTRSVVVQNIITHTTTRGWKNRRSFDLGIDLKIKDSKGLSLSYKHDFEKHHSESRVVSNISTSSFTVENSRTLPPHTYSECKLLVRKIKKTIPYTAIVVAKFSSEFQGFLRWGGGYRGSSTNYHIDHRGSEKRPTFNYQFGDGSVPFFKDLKLKSETKSRPWMWNDMNNAYPSLRHIINKLSNENEYVFQLNGTLEFVEGFRVYVEWGETKNISGANNYRWKRSAEVTKSRKYYYIMTNSINTPANLIYPKIKLNTTNNFDLIPMPLDKFNN